MRNNRPNDPPLPTRTPPDLVNSFKKRLEADVPGLSTIFTDATMYEQIIRECPDYFRAGLLPLDAEKKLSELYGKDLRGKQKPRKYTCPVTGFSHLVGKDLDPRERAVSDRLAKLAVSNWMPGGDGILSEEPDSDEAEPDAETSSSSSEETSILSPISGIDEALPSGSGDVEERLEPDDIVRLLSEEFGPLAEEGEEKLLLEADGAVFRDVIILGVIHLTTHRLTFHASLASAQPNSASRVIRAGPVTVHPRGMRRKRRVWLELSSDMLSTYASARDEDRIRPQRSILLSSLKEVKLMSSRHPRHIHIVFDGLSHETEAVVEFDTEESMREWRRELQGALYLYRRNRIAILRSHRHPSADSDSVSIDSVDEDDDTVRIHIPLYRIKRTERVDCMSFASFLNLTVCTACPHPTSPGASADAFVGDVDGPRIPSPNEDRPPAGTSTLEHPPDLQTLQLALMQSTPAWERVEEYIMEAKGRVGDVEVFEERWAGAKVSVELEPQALEADGSFEEALAEPSDVMEGGDKGMDEQGERRGWASLMVPSSLSPTSLIPSSLMPSSLVPSSLVPASLVPSSMMPTWNKDGAKGKKSNAEYEKIEKKICKALALDPAQVIWVGKATAITRIFANFTGYIALTKDNFGFWSKSCSFGQDIKYRLPNDLISSVKTYTSHLSIGDHGIAVAVRGQQDLRFAFRKHLDRDEAVMRINILIESARQRPAELVASPPATPGTATPSTTGMGGARAGTVPSGATTPTRSSADSARAGTMLARSASTMLSKPVGRSTSLPYVLRSFMPKAINLPADRTYLNMPSLHFVCLTIGSRGDVQPYIALGLGLMAKGHTVTIVTHEEYKEWVERFGIGHRTAGGDPGALMKLSVENKMFTPQFFREGISHFRSWFDDLLQDAWKQTQDADVLLESPSAMAGVHIAEALRIPYFRTFTMPWSKTHDFPHAFLSPPVESPTFNIASYVLFDNVMWAATSGQINRWRKSVLQIGSTDMGHLAQSKIPYIYNFSQAVVPRPLDWGDATTISGYWFLDNPDQDWKAPQSLLDWMDKARKDQKPIVYIGFGSIVVPDPTRVTKNIIQAVLKSGVRAIISKGWSSRMEKVSDEEPITFPEETYSLDKVPHDWLFPQIDAVLHHGGAGTTGASLRAGLPTLIRPWFGDQYFWASRVQKLGAGLKVSSLRVHELSEALTRATTDRIMREKAAVVGERIRRETGVQNAIQAIYTYMPRAARDRTTID